MRREKTLFLTTTCVHLAISWVLICGSAGAAQEQQPKSGTVIGQLKSQKNTPDDKNTFIEVLAPGEEQARRYHVLYDAKAKGPIEPVLKAVRAAKVGDRVELKWVQTGHGPAIKSFLVLKKGAPLDDKPLTPTEARKKIGEKVTVEMTVRAAKDWLDRRGEIYLDSESEFRDDKNFAVVITKAGAARLKEAGIADPAARFMGKKIRVSGTVKEVDKVPRIEVDDAKQIAAVNE